MSVSDKSDGVPALHRRAVEVWKAPTVTAALLLSRCAHGRGCPRPLRVLRAMDLERRSTVMARLRLATRRSRRAPTALRAPLGRPVFLETLNGGDGSIKRRAGSRRVAEIGSGDRGFQDRPVPAVAEAHRSCRPELLLPAEADPAQVWSVNCGVLSFTPVETALSFHGNSSSRVNLDR